MLSWSAPGARGVLCGLWLLATAGCGPGHNPVPEPETWPEDWTAREDEMLALVNEARAAATACPSGPKAAAPALVRDAALRSAARGHAWDMATQQYFDHDGLDGRDPFDRMTDAGYTGSPAAENIAAGNVTAEATLEQWLTSTSGHCDNIMDPDLVDIGIGFASDEDAPFAGYWVQNFGR